LNQVNIRVSKHFRPVGPGQGVSQDSVLNEDAVLQPQLALDPF
jgi:hypothetical protein